MKESFSRDFLSSLVILTWLAGTAIEYCSAVQNCTDNDFIVPPSLVKPKSHSHYVGKLWRIDCRTNEDNSSEVRLYQDGVLRKPDDRVLILKEQIFTLLSKNISDIGEYSCKSYCNKSKTVGELIADTVKRSPKVYPEKQNQLVSGSNTTCSCEVEGVYKMYWYRVSSNGSKTLFQSDDESYWKNGSWFTRRRFKILNFTVVDEDLYMCVIERSTDKYVADKEIFLNLRDSYKNMLIPFHWYYTSFSNTEIDGHLFRTILHVYICHLPVIINLSVFEPVKGIAWTRNFTTDQSQPLKLGRISNYGVTLQMHVHSFGRYKDLLQITALIVRLNARVSHSSIEVMNQKFKTAKCNNREKCSQPTPNRIECPRYLDTLKENVNATFILTLIDPCNETYNLQIRDRSSSPPMNGSLLDVALQNATQIKMELKGYGKDVDKFTFQGNATFSQWCLRLHVDEIFSNTHRVKLFLEMPTTGLSGNFLVMEGDYVIKCLSQDKSNENSTTIAVCVALAVFGFIAFAAVCLYRKFNRRPRDEILLDSMEVEPVDL